MSMPSQATGKPVKWIRGAALLLLAGLLVGTVSCKRKATPPPSVTRDTRTVGPSSEDVAKEARAKLMADLDLIPNPGNGKTQVAPDGEVWSRFDNGMMIHVLRPGEGGLPPKLGQTVSVAYIGTFPGSNKEFDRCSRDHPMTFKLGSKSLVKGFSMGVSQMHVGEKARIFLPPDLAYGEKGNPGGGILGNQALIFELELLSITGESVGFTLDDLPKFEPLGPMPDSAPAPVPADAPATAPAPSAQP